MFLDKFVLIWITGIFFIVILDFFQTKAVVFLFY